MNALVSGGALPVARRGQKEKALVTVWDWYSTYAAIAGVDPTDRRAAAVGLPPIDSVNQWPLISGTNTTAPRTEIALGDTTAVNPNGDGDTLVGGVMQVRNGTTYKLILGTPGKLYIIDQDTVTGPLWPNSSSHLVPTTHSRTCGRKAERGCLFDVIADPLEEHNLGEKMPGLFASMLARIDELQKTVYSPKRGRCGHNDNHCLRAATYMLPAFTHTPFVRLAFIWISVPARTVPLVRLLRGDIPATGARGLTYDIQGDCYVRVCGSSKEQTYVRGGRRTPSPHCWRSRTVYARAAYVVAIRRDIPLQRIYTYCNIQWPTHPSLQSFTKELK